jgi:chitodextrinase
MITTKNSRPQILLFLLLSFFFGGLKGASQGDTITLNLSAPTKPSNFTLDAEKGYWTETYNTAEEYRYIEFGLFRLTHILNRFGGTDVGGGMSYWDGFTYCTSGDTHDYGEMGSSDGWVANQWGCMAGGGIKTNESGNVLVDNDGKVLTEQSKPYMVAYWGYWEEEKNGRAPCLQIQFTDNKQYKPVGIYIANHPWPWYGNIHGDGFARPFVEGDYFKLLIHGLNEAGEDIGTAVEYTLAEFKDGELHQSPDWKWVNLSALGTVSGIYFTMKTTDADPIYGANTAVYFCMDKLQVLPVQGTTVPARPTGLQSTAHETNIEFSWNASAEQVAVKGYNLYLDSVFKEFVSNALYNFIGLKPFTQYQLAVEAVATDGTPSEKAIINVKTTDETAPSAPANLTGTSTRYTISLLWDASTDNVAVTEYHIYLNGERQKRVYTTGYILTGLDAGTKYSVEVEARDAAGNSSQKASVWLTTSEVTSITTTSGNSTPDVYPNPTSGIIYINTTEDIDVRISNLQGTQLLQQTISSGENVVDISHLLPGIYILKYGKQTKKIVKN